MCDDCPPLRPTALIPMAAETDLIAATVRLARIAGHDHAARVFHAALTASAEAGIGRR